MRNVSKVVQKIKTHFLWHFFLENPVVYETWKTLHRQAGHRWQ